MDFTKFHTANSVKHGNLTQNSWGGALKQPHPKIHTKIFVFDDFIMFRFSTLGLVLYPKDDF